MESTTRSPAARRTWAWVFPSRHGKRAGAAFHCLLPLRTRKDQRDCRPHDANPERPGPHIQRWILVPGCRRRIEQLGVGEALSISPPRADLPPLISSCFNGCCGRAPAVGVPPSRQSPHEYRYRDHCLSDPGLGRNLLGLHRQGKVSCCAFLRQREVFSCGHTDSRRMRPGVINVAFPSSTIDGTCT